MSVLFHMSRFLTCGVRFLNLIKFVSPTEFVIRDLALLQVVMKASDTLKVCTNAFQNIHIQIRMLIRDDLSSNFDVLLTVNLSIILAIDQLSAQILVSSS